MIKLIENRLILSTLIAGGLMLSNNASAEYIARLAIESGGDELIEVSTASGDRELKAGGLAHIEFGFIGRLISTNLAWETEATLGYKSDAETFQNGEMRFGRFSLNLVQFYRFTETIRLGAGATYHLGTKLSVDLDGLGFNNSALVVDEDAENALGFVVAIDYTLSRYISLGIRATQIDYEFENPILDDSIGGNSAGVYASINF